MVSVIITTKNEEKNIERLLTSIKKQKYKTVEIVVVDNNSQDKTVDISKKYTKNVFTKGPERSVQRNFGVSKSKGDYLLILDADMELTPNVISDCIKKILKYKALIIPEKTVGQGILAEVRKFEREMYMGDKSIEVARFFRRDVFLKLKGYDTELTGAEDYDLPKRIMDKYGDDSIAWSKEWILHHETGLTLEKQLQKKFYYAKNSAAYAAKYPELVKTQGNMLLRKAYFKNWRKFLKKPFLASVFIFVRVLEAIAAIMGYISAVGFVGFIKTLQTLFKYEK